MQKACSVIDKLMTTGQCVWQCLYAEKVDKDWAKISNLIWLVVGTKHYLYTSVKILPLLKYGLIHQLYQSQTLGIYNSRKSCVMSTSTRRSTGW
jgi:hypothetical protein